MSCLDGRKTSCGGGGIVFWAILGVKLHSFSKLVIARLQILSASRKRVHRWDKSLLRVLITLNDSSTFNPRFSAKERSMFVVKIQTEMFIDETEKTWYKKRKHAAEGTPPLFNPSQSPQISSGSSRFRLFHFDTKGDPPGIAL